MRKLDLASEVKERVGGMSMKEASLLVNILLESMREALLRGENVKISGFGNFEVRPKKGRVGRNPHTGDAIALPARKVLTFKPSQLLRDQLNR
ncbi:MAG: integration host factor subunit alpha [Deltaproteobacteria bacterium]|nr:integration host factor subunit alpha [Deltaproteobacteria bacterium]